MKISWIDHAALASWSTERAKAVLTDWRTTVTGKPPTELQTLIDTHINGFNTQNRERFLSVFGDTAIVIDGIARSLVKSKRSSPLVG
jgi:hypothetical protein